MTGAVFGCWTVLHQTGNAPKGGALWLCRCICGKERSVLAGDLRNGKSTACGCSQSRIARGKPAPVKQTRLYVCWQNMRARCNNPKNIGWKHYGAKGIAVCKEWDRFIVFKRWAEDAGYMDNLSIERIDNSLGYSPENCTWADAKQQARNRSIVRVSPSGKTYAEIAEENGVPVTTMNSRICSGQWSPEVAATTPVGSVKKKPKRNEFGQFVQKQPGEKWKKKGHS